MGCRRNSGIIDVTDKKCPKTDEVCCKRPNYRAKQCDPVSVPVNANLSSPLSDWSSCGRNASGILVLSGSEDSSLAQPGEFPHMCVIYRSVSHLSLLSLLTGLSPHQDPAWPEGLHWRGLSHRSKQTADRGSQVLGGVSGTER